MKSIPKILVAYDGSEFSHAAISDLKYAGLGPKAKVRVITVCDSWQPTLETLSVAGNVVLGQAYAMSKVLLRDELKAARELAEKGAQRVRRDFPGWNVSAVTALDSPANGILKAAEKWKPYLIVLGSRGHSTFDRLLLGSVSHKVLTHAECNVRIVRPSKISSSAHLLVAVDGSKNSEAMIKDIETRVWKADVEFRVVVVMDYRLSLVQDIQSAFGSDSRNAFYRKLAESTARILSQRGFRASAVVREGDPRREILLEIKRFKANSLFLGSRGLGSAGRFLLGSVSSNLSEHAPCTVEIDRR